MNNNIIYMFFHLYIEKYKGQLFKWSLARV